MSLSSGFTITDGGYEENDNRQVSKLQVAPNPTSDQTYVCKVKPTDQVASDTDVKLDVYGTYFRGRYFF